MVDTKSVKDRRPLRFDTPAQMWADVDRIVAAERAGKLRRAGNWTPGQIFGHLGGFIDYAYDGFPKQPPWFIRMICKPMKNKYLNKGLPSGVKIPGTKGGTWSIDELPLDEGLARMRRSWDRLQRESPTGPHPLFGPISHEEWKNLHLRHAELHLSFLHPQ